MAKLQSFVLWGSSGHAKVLGEIVAAQGGQVIALFDNCEVPSAIAGVPVFWKDVGFKDWRESYGDLHGVAGLMAIGGGRGRDRLDVQRLFQKWGISTPAIFHPAAAISPGAIIGVGSQVLALANVAADARIGDACIINHCASVDHECTLGNGVHVAPGATLCGCVTLGDNVFVGAGAIILPRISIGENAVIGAGAVVTKNVPPNATVVGNPAKPV